MEGKVILLCKFHTTEYVGHTWMLHVKKKKILLYLNLYSTMYYYKSILYARIDGVELSGWQSNRVDLT